MVGQSAYICVATKCHCYLFQRVMVSCRADAKRVEAKGLFAGAEVVRGPNWKFGDQDGNSDYDILIYIMESSPYRGFAQEVQAGLVEWKPLRDGVTRLSLL